MENPLVDDGGPLERWRPQFLSILRIVTAALFLAHGTSKILGFPASTASFPPPWTQFWMAGMLELVGGALLLVGLFSRPTAFILAGEMAVAYWLVHAPENFFPVLNGGEAAILFCFIFLYISVAGPGPWSLDAMWQRKKAVDGPVGYYDGIHQPRNDAA